VVVAPGVKCMHKILLTQPQRGYEFSQGRTSIGGWMKTDTPG
jgi:hypothetical protein